MLARAGQLIAPHLHAKRVAIVTDETVEALHGQALRDALPGLDIHMIIRPAGEAQKSFDGLQACSADCLRLNLIGAIRSLLLAAA